MFLESVVRRIHKHLIVNSPSGQFKDSGLMSMTSAVHVCPTGAILIKRTGYQVPIGERIYDHKQINEVALHQEQKHDN